MAQTNTATPANLNGIAAGPLSIGTLAVNPATGRLYFRINSGSTATVGYYEPSTNTAAALPTSLGAVAVIKVNPVLNRIYLSGSDNKLHVLDGTTHNEVATLTMGSANTSIASLQNWIAVNKTTGRVYVADRDADTLWVVNGQNNTVVTSLAGLESPIAVAVNEAQNRVYVLDGGDDTLLVIDGNTNKIVQNIQLPMNPVAMALDDNITPAQIYVTGDCPSGGGCVGTSSGVMVVSDPVDPIGPITLSAVGPAGARHDFTQGGRKPVVQLECRLHGSRSIRVHGHRYARSVRDRHDQSLCRDHPADDDDVACRRQDGTTVQPAARCLGRDGAVSLGRWWRSVAARPDPQRSDGSDLRRSECQRHLFGNDRRV
jgi:YVTN family beta-propeller protein